MPVGTVNSDWPRSFALLVKSCINDCNCVVLAIRLWSCAFSRSMCNARYHIKNSCTKQASDTTPLNTHHLCSDVPHAAVMVSASKHNNNNKLKLNCMRYRCSRLVFCANSSVINVIEVKYQSVHLSGKHKIHAGCPAMLVVYGVAGSVSSACPHQPT